MRPKLPALGKEGGNSLPPPCAYPNCRYPRSTTVPPSRDQQHRSCETDEPQHGYRSGTQLGARSRIAASVRRSPSLSLSSSTRRGVPSPSLFLNQRGFRRIEILLDSAFSPSKFSQLFSDRGEAPWSAGGYLESAAPRPAASLCRRPLPRPTVCHASSSEPDNDVRGCVLRRSRIPHAVCSPGSRIVAR